MRRKDKQMPEEWAVTEVIRRSQVCRLGLSDGLYPYVIPMCFGYEEGFLYLHSAAEGRKLEMIRQNDRVCFEFDIDVELVESPEPCNWSMRYKSVIGYGRAAFVEDVEEKRKALDVIMEQYSEGEFVFPQASVERIVVVKIAIEGLSGKASGY